MKENERIEKAKAIIILLGLPLVISFAITALPEKTSILTVYFFKQ